MALFQPTNVIPSTFAGVGGGTIDANNQVSISWQVNGNSPMIGFSITFYHNDPTSSAAGTTGVISLEQPFYGTDEKGNPVIYTYEPENTTWANWTLNTISGSSLLSFTNGNEYQMKITQYWGDSISDSESVSQYSESVFITRSTPVLNINNFGIATGSDVTVTTIQQDFSATYSQEQEDSLNWVEWILFDNTTNSLLLDTGKIVTSVLSTSYNGFITGTEDEPHNYTITCMIETENGVQLTDTVYFNVLYTVEDNTKPIEVSCENDGSYLINYDSTKSILGTPSFPQSEIPDHIINSELILNNGESVTWSTENGSPLQIEAPYNIELFTNATPPAVYQNKYGSSAIQVLAIDPNGFILAGGGNGAVIYKTNNNGSLTLFQTLYYDEEETQPIDGAVYSAKFFTIGNAQILAIGGTFQGCLRIYLYNFQGSGKYLASDLVFSPSSYPISGTINCISYSENSNIRQLFVGGTMTYSGETKYGMFFNFSGTTFSYDHDLNVDNTVSDAQYCYYNSTLYFLAGGSFTGKAYLYTISPISPYLPSNTINIYADSGTTALGANTTTVCFVPNNNAFLLGFSSGYGAKYYKVSSNTVNFVSDIDLSGIGNSGSTSRLSSVNKFYFDPTNSNRICICCGSSVPSGAYKVGLYHFYNDSFAFVYPLYMTSGSTLIGPNVNTAVFSLDGTKLYIGGSFNNYFLQFSVIPSKSDMIFGAFIPPDVPDIYISKEWYGFSVSFNIGFSGTYYIYYIENSTNIKIALPQTIDPPDQYDRIFGHGFFAYWFNNSVFNGSSSKTNTLYSFNNINSISVYGDQILDYIYITKQENYTPTQTAVKPERDENTLFYADFNDNDGLEAGIASSSLLYRSDGINLLSFPINSNEVSQLKDFGAKSLISYTYQLYYITSDTLTSQLSSGPVCTQLKSFYLMEATEDTTYPNVFHVKKVWKFGNNMEFGTVSNGNNPSWLNNFTQYRYRQPATTSGKSGTLQALLGNTTNGEYNDTAQMMDELFAASLTTNPLFLKDMKGNLYMVSISAPITQTVDTQNGVQQVTVSIPWEEIGSTDGIALIQLPTDEGWGQTV